MYDNVHAEDLAQEIANIEKNAYCLVLSKIVSINKVIKKVVEEISSICAANRFQFAYNNDMIDFTIIWKHGVILPTILANNFLKYLKSFQRN